jgi:tetratricopeptide (TPR) repeat protein
MSDQVSAPETAPRRRYVPAVGPRLRKVLGVVFGLFALLAVNSIYLLSVRGLEAATGRTYQDWFYLVMFVLHLVLGLAIVVPVVVFGILHIKNARNRPNRRAVRVGYALFATALVLLASGFVLTRIEGVIEVRDPAVRSTAYWLHVATPVIAAWLFVLHRLAGKRIRWKVGLRWAAVAGVFAVAMVIVHAQDPRRWNVEGPKEGEKYFFPSLARTSTGDFIPAKVLQYDSYCLECHGDVHARWSNSAHRFSSFNNPAYLFAVKETREFSMRLDGDVRRSRWCAGCHDTVPFFSGAFDDPDFDMEADPTAHAGLTCTTCHAITHVNSVRGNADYTIEEPQHYPFAFSENRSLQWVNRQLVKSKPDFHKRTFLKPLHRTTEFCSTCHKVHLPPELNDYKFLRGQNHYDSFFLSGVSGQGVTSFYYPEKAQANCAGCHMPLAPSDDFGARDFDGSGERKVHDHLFPAANTGVPHLVDLPDKETVIEAHREFNRGVMRIDLFGLRRGGAVDGELIAPLRPEVPALVPGEPYLLETVVRTVKMGHEFTQGTVDSNEVWVRLAVTDGAGRRIGMSGGYGPGNEVDRWSHFVNVYMLDREGNRINRRNPQDIFVPLYNHQIPPGAADALHYRLVVPPGTPGPVTVEAELLYRKFDTEYMRLVHAEQKGIPPEEYVNDLPVMTLATDRVAFPVAGAAVAASTNGGTPAGSAPPPEPEWQRWNDYGIGLLRKGGKSSGELRQAEEAFARVEALGRPDGPLNLARVYLAQGTVRDKAVEALARAAAFDPPAPPWSVAWFSGVVDKQNGYLDEAIASFRSIVELDDAETRRRGFDFSKDYRLLVELGQTLVERAKMERGETGRARREELLREAAGWFEEALSLDPENVPAHWNLNLAYRQLGDQAKAAEHFERWQEYRPDDNARDRAIAIARRADPAADHAADAIVIYDLHRPGAYGLDGAAEPARQVARSGEPGGGDAPPAPEPAGEPAPPEAAARGSGTGPPQPAGPDVQPASGAPAS